MKKMIMIFVLACICSVATKAEFSPLLSETKHVDARNNIYVNPFSPTYNLSIYLWFTDIDLTNFLGSIRTIWDEMARLRRMFPHGQFSHVWYAGLDQFEYGFCDIFNQSCIYSDLRW